MNIKNKKAFTLLELLMVVIIIGILATLAVPQYEKFKEKAIAAEAVNMLGVIRREVDMAMQIDDDTNIQWPAPNKYWFYIIGGQGHTPKCVEITAQRRGSGPYAGTEITLHWDNEIRVVAWEGTHPGTPGGPRSLP